MSSDGSEATCTCRVFTTLLQKAEAEPRCHHTGFVRMHLEVLRQLPTYSPGEVVPIGPAAQLQVGGRSVGRGGWVAAAWFGECGALHFLQGPANRVTLRQSACIG